MMLEPRLLSTKAEFVWGGASVLLLIGGVLMLLAR